MLLVTFLIITSCEEENTPANPSNPANPANYFIMDCDTMNVDIEFTGTQFFNSNNGGTINIDGVQDWNNTCYYYVDEAQMITDGVNYIDIMTSTFVPTQYASKAEFEFTSPSNPNLEIHITNNDARITGAQVDDAFHLDITIPEIGTQPLNTPISIVGSKWKNMLYDNFFDASYMITFTNIDMVNNVFEGNMSIQFSPQLLMNDINGNPIYTEYNNQTNTNFTATVNYFKFTLE